MIRGSCLCGGVRFEVDRVVGPFSLCHCNRCRKTSGSAFLAAVGVRRDFVDVKSSWYEIADDMPQLDKQALIRLRQGGR